MVKITGTDGGALNTVEVIIAGTEIAMRAIDEVTWENSGTEIEAMNPVSVFMSVWAPNSTSWAIEINLQGNDQPCYKDSGITGEKLASRANKRVANFSERIVSVNC